MINQEHFQARVEKLVGFTKLQPPMAQQANWHIEILESEGAKVIRGIWKLVVLEELMTEYPADWWQAFKERWFPGWLKKKSPVRMMQVVARHKFPDFQSPNNKVRSMSLINWTLGREFVDVRKVQKQDTDSSLRSE